MQDILDLSVSERILIMEKIWDGIDHSTLPIPFTHEQESDSRLARYHNGRTKFVSWEDIKSALNASE